MAALLQAFADKRVLVCAWCVSMEGARSAPWMWVAICRTGVRGPLLAASLAFERLPSKQLAIVFPTQFDASSCVAGGKGLKSFDMV